MCTNYHEFIYTLVTSSGQRATFTMARYTPRVSVGKTCHRCKGPRLQDATQLWYTPFWYPASHPPRTDRHKLDIWNNQDYKHRMHYFIAGKQLPAQHCCLNIWSLQSFFPFVSNTEGPLMCSLGRHTQTAYNTEYGCCCLAFSTKPFFNRRMSLLVLFLHDRAQLGSLNAL